MPTADPARILFVCDSGPEVGGGHVMRSLTLAAELHRRGLVPVFAATPDAASVLDRFAETPVERRPVAREDLAALDAGAFEAAAVVFDHFGLSAPQHRAIAKGRPTLVIDDLADRPLGADLVLDVGLKRTPADYAGWAGEGTRLLLGPAFALVRPAFVAARPESMARRAAAEGPARVLVSLGLTDVGGITGRLVARMQPRLGQSKLDVVLGSGASSLESVERLAARDPRITVHLDVRDMAGLVAAADLVVGAGGSSSWERCVLGAPTLLVVLADNQAPGAVALERAGAVDLADARAPEFEAAFDRAFTGLLASPDRRRRLSRLSAALCDGQGATRVADALQTLLAR